MPYRDLCRASPFAIFPLGLVARLPYAMTPLGTLMLVHHATRSFAFAGAAVAAQSLATASGGILLGRVAHRTSIRRLGGVMAVTNAIAVGGLIASTGAGRLPLLTAAALAGATQPQVGPFVRVHWSYLAQSRPHWSRLMTTALAYEAAADEASFIAGPILVGLLVAASTPVPAAGPLLACILLLLAAATPLACLYARGPARVRSREPTPPLPRGTLAVVFAAMAVAGAIFGVVQVGVTAYATAGDDPSVGGLLYAALGAGSAVAGIAYGWLPYAVRLEHRFRLVAVGLLSAMTCLAFGGTWLPLWTALLVAGVGIAPYLITVYAVTEHMAPTRVATTMTIVCAAGPVGTAAGQALGGQLVESSGYGGALAVAPIIAAVGVVLTWVNPTVE